MKFMNIVGCILLCAVSEPVDDDVVAPGAHADCPAPSAAIPSAEALPESGVTVCV
jgi:hypothetical protein